MNTSARIETSNAEILLAPCSLGGVRVNKIWPFIGARPVVGIPCSG